MHEGDNFSNSPVASHARLLALAKIIITSGKFDVHHGQALAMAHDLARLLDGLQIIGKSIDDLDGIQLERRYCQSLATQYQILEKYFTASLAKPICNSISNVMW